MQNEIVAAAAVEELILGLKEFPQCSKYSSNMTLAVIEEKIDWEKTRTNLNLEQL